MEEFFIKIYVIKIYLKASKVKNNWRQDDGTSVYVPSLGALSAAVLEESFNLWSR